MELPVLIHREGVWPRRVPTLEAMEDREGEFHGLDDTIKRGLDLVSKRFEHHVPQLVQ